MLEYNDNVHIYLEKKLQRHMIIDVQQYSAFSFLPMVALALVSILQSIFYVVYPVPAIDTLFPWIALRQSAINNLLAPKPTPKPSSNPIPNPSSSKKTKTDIKLPKCRCSAEQYHLFDICCF